MNYLQNAWKDLDYAEQEQRNALEKQLRETVKVLIDLANALRHEAMESIRREDPKSPYNWTYLDWRRFWFEERTIVSDDIRNGWGEVSLEEASVHPDVLGVQEYNMLDVFRALRDIERGETQKTNLEKIGEAHRRELREKNRQIAELSNKLAAARQLLENNGGSQDTGNSKKNIEQVSLSFSGNKTVEIGTQDKGNVVPEILFEDELKLWEKTPLQDELPAHWRSSYRKSQSKDRISKVFEILFSIYTAGLFNRYEIHWLCSILTGSSIRSIGIKRTFYDLREEELIVDLPIDLQEENIKTSMSFCMLTQKGQQLCKDWGLPKPIRDSKLQSAINNGADPESPINQMTFVFAFHAHTRNWEYQYLKGDEANLLVTQGNKKYAVVAAPLKVENFAITDKLQKLHDKGENPAFVTISPERGEKLSEWCKEHDISCAYTTIKHLIDKNPETDEIVPFTFDDYVEGSLPLWIEEWD